jgi:hypothetical protein
MIRTGLIASLLFSLAAACAASPQAGPDPRWTPQQQEIIALLENGPMGIETDFEAWENEFHDDWTVWFAGQPDAHAKGPHMARVRDYIGRGARVVSYEAEFADIAIVGLTALARFNAIETLQEPDGTPPHRPLCQHGFPHSRRRRMENPGHNRLLHGRTGRGPQLSERRMRPVHPTQPTPPTPAPSPA